MGRDPQAAAASRILFLPAGASGLGVTAAILTEARHRLRLDRRA
ncbi:hypothetical protein [Methylobacterium aquaticum]|nr:hypothetical protein [Methylobacterium aquaticum]